MANKPKKSEAENQPKWHTTAWAKSKPHLITVADWVLKITAAVYLTATSFMYTRDWLQNVEVNSDFALAGGIMVTSIALYLVVRKR